MQVISLESGRQVARRGFPDGTADALLRAQLSDPVQATDSTQATDLVHAASAERAVSAPIRRASRIGNTDLNRQIAGAQQALAYLDHLGAQLQGLKTALVARLAEAQREQTAGGADAGTKPRADAAGEALDQQIRRFSELWRNRSAATAGALDARLSFSAPGEARQSFRVRGLNMASLRTGGRETLTLAVGGQGRRVTATVAIEPDMTDEALVSRLDRALAPLGIRAERDSGGELLFSVPEAAWPLVRDTLTIRGEGRRFPTGQFNQVRTLPEPSVIRPENWSAADEAALRRTLQQVNEALNAVRRARQDVSRVLAELGRQLAPRTAEADALWSSEFARHFERTAGRADYEVLSAIMPALLGINRHRVLALLSLAPG